MNTIRNEWQAMINRGIIPCIEYQTSSNDWLLVDIELSDNGLMFSFDSDNKPTFFDGDIIPINDNRYILPIDPDFSLDSHLETISNNMVEGYLIPNDLFIVKIDKSPCYKLPAFIAGFLLPSIPH